MLPNIYTYKMMIISLNLLLGSTGFYKSDLIIRYNYTRVLLLKDMREMSLIIPGKPLTYAYA